MKVRITFPYAADAAIGEQQNLYGVPFLVLESGHRESVYQADLPEDEAQAMIEAGRCYPVAEEPPVITGKK